MFKIPDMLLSDIMKRFAILVALFLSCAAASAQAGEREQIDTVRLWPDGAPNAFTIPEPGSGFIVFKAHDYEDAMMEVYPARNPNGLCVIMCPGGAYIMESQTYEGRDMKDWFNARGITYCMLQYRLPCGHHDVPLSDVQQAMIDAGVVQSAYNAPEAALLLSYLLFEF